MLTEFEKNVFHYIEEHREGMIDYFWRLVSVDTQILPGLNYDCLCEIMAGRSSGLGCETSIHEASQKYFDLSGADFLSLLSTEDPTPLPHCSVKSSTINTS